jgi:predicted site-specific integrase-resolvase
LHWEEQWKIKVYKTSGGHLRYLKSDLEKLNGMEVEKAWISSKTLCVTYARVSTKTRDGGEF